jgi:DNA-binding response OmpR family regulator/tetratricopeptide (TPR) repeat protein
MPQTVLIAEDDRGVTKQLTRVVEEAGYRCVAVPDGAQALQQARTDAPDLILLDLLLPKMDGRGVLATLQQRADTRDIPVIAMSGIFRGRSTARELRDAGAQGFLEKPFSGEDLIAHLHALIGPAQDEAQADEEGEETSATPNTISLAERTTAEVLWEAMSQGFSGALQFQLEKRHKVVILENGAPRQVRSNSVSECLGRRLFRAGRIDGDALQESLRRSKAGERQGEALVKMGVATQEDIDHELLAQAEDKLLELFGWDEGRCWRQEGVTNISYATELENWTPRLAVLRGANRMSAERAQRQLAPLTGFRLVARDADLGDEELVIPEIAEALAVIKSGGATADVVESHPGALYGLWLTGVVRLVDGESGRVVSEAPAPDESSNAEDATLKGALAALQTKNHFEMLEVAEGADAKQVRDAFMKLAKSYHPDRYSTKSESSRALASEIFALLSTANETLAKPDSQRAYVRSLATGHTAADEREEVERILGAEQVFSRGEALFRKRAYKQALELFKEAVESQGDEADYHAYFGWTHYLVNHRTSGASQLAREHIEKAVALAPESSTGYYFLGRLHKACAEPGLARKMFRTVLDIDPDHVEASRELRLIEMRKEKDSKSGGLFGLGKKRK